MGMPSGHQTSKSGYGGISGFLGNNALTEVTGNTSDDKLILPDGTSRLGGASMHFLNVPSALMLIND
jgi:hypothetical protein